MDIAGVSPNVTIPLSPPAILMPAEFWFYRCPEAAEIERPIWTSNVAQMNRSK